MFLFDYWSGGIAENTLFHRALGTGEIYPENIT